MIARETRVAFVSAWLIVSAVLLAVLLAPSLLPEHTLRSASAALRSSHHDRGACVFCGMTRAFVAISRGDFAQAAAANRWAIPLHALLLVNGALALIFLSARVRRLSPSRRAARRVEPDESTR